MLDFPRWKIWAIVLTLIAGTIFALPNLFPEAQVARWPSWLPNKQINLGLDLRGGSHLLLAVDTNAVVKQQLESLEDSVRATLRETRDAGGGRIGYGDFERGPNAVSFLIRDATDVDAAVEALRSLSQPVGGSFSAQRNLEVSVSDGTRVTVRLTEAGINERKRLAVEQSIEIVRRRIDEMGTREPTIVRQGDDRILVQVPGLKDPRQLKEILGKTAKLEFKLVNTDVSPEDVISGRVPPGTELLPMQGAEGQKVAVRRRVIISGEELADAQPTYNQGMPVVSFRFNAAGGRRFGQVTTENVGKPFAIILDNEVISAPRINEPILGGSGIISGGFTVEQANNLAVLLRAGALPAPLQILEERTVGPDLGADSIRAGIIACAIGTVLVLALMFVSYGRFGMFANAALVLNVILIIGVMTFLGATLTLPGIAGLVLTIGTAVDANVLIFERIREELRAGRNTLSAVDAGYREASRAIWDANITNVIAAVLMMWFGSGPVKGFAVVLTIGIITSVFTGVTVCRMFNVLWLKRARPAKLVL
ncbi:protein translocase subunit SecD [Pedomonas sp. V897]|uniref:protein translocase subunit SecD n=1 Tax=Pedomonas sp. V897 TaxID=3446482 RepID=UPI003EDF99EE